MGTRRMLAVAGCTAVAVGVGAGSAFAGEITGNGKPTQGPTPANVVRNALFSGQNDVPEGDPETASGPDAVYGQDVVGWASSIQAPSIRATSDSGEFTLASWLRPATGLRLVVAGE